MLRFNIMPSVRVSAALWLASTALLTTPALSQSEDDMEVIHVTGTLGRYSATKSDIPVMETPRSVSIETGAELIERGALNLADAYVYSAGVTGETFGFATRGDWIAVRGLSAPEYRDSLQALFGSYNNSRSDIYTLEQVEILRGPAAVLYGQGSPGGLVNVVSKTPRDNFGGELAVSVGSHDTYQVQGDVTGPVSNGGDLLYRLIGVYREGGTQVDHVDETAMVFAPSVTWRPGDATSITFLVNHQDTESNAGAQFLPVYGTLLPAPNGQYIDPNAFLSEPGFDRYDTKSTDFTLLAEHRVNDNLLLEATLRRSESEADYAQAWVSFIGGDRWIYNPDGTLYGGGLLPRTFYVSDASSEQLAVDLRARSRFSTGDIRHSLLVGFQYQDVRTENDFAYGGAVGFDWQTRQPDAIFGTTYWIDPFNPVYGNVPPQALIDSIWTDNPQAKTEDLGLYLHDQMEIGNWLVTAGLRADRVDTNPGSGRQRDEAISSSFAVMYRFANGVSPYASYSESFEPILGTLFDGSSFDPQEGRQYELGVKIQPEGTDAQITLAVFDIEQSNLLTTDPVNAGFQVQTGDVEIQGVELESRWSWQDFGFELNASHLSHETSDGYQLPSIPENQASAWVRYTPSSLDKLITGLGVRYVGASQNGADSLETPDYTLVDAMIGWQTDQWGLTLSARNLLDEPYIATCLARGDCFPGEDRTVTARLSRRF